MTVMSLASISQDIYICFMLIAKSLQIELFFLQLFFKSPQKCSVVFHSLFCGCLDLNLISAFEADINFYFIFSSLKSE